MTTAIKRRRGTTSQHSTFTGLEGEITIDTTKDTVVVHDGSTAGGFPLAKENNPTFTGTVTIPTADINGGAIDGAVIGGASAAAGTFTTITAGGGAFTGNVTFGDSNKALFGAGSDLEIYHSGSASFIKETGTGNLKIEGTNIELNNGAGNKTYMLATDGGAVQLRYDDAAKLATTSTGIDVTGTVTADGLTVDGDVLIDDGVGRITLDSVSGSNRLLSTTTGFGAYEDFEFRADNYIFKTSTTERMRINSSGNVGIGTSSPNANLGFSIGSDIKISQVASAAHQAANAGSIGLTISDGGGHSGVFVNNSHDGTYSDQFITFNTAEGGVSASTERMRIDSSGNVLVGKTSADFGATVGMEMRTNDTLYVARSGGASLALNRTSSDGDIAEFRKDGTTVGSIGVDDNASGSGKTVYISSGNSSSSLDVGFKFDWAANQITPCQSGGANRDNAVDLGSSSVRFDDIYATNGTIQTSDRNEKQDIEALSEAEQRVAVAAKGLLRKFRWIDSVEEKGNDARIHFGIIAQDLQAAFEAEGLDAGRYAMFINSTWTDEETGEERSRMGVRYNQLLAFIIAAI